MQYRIDFRSMPWTSNMDGVRQKTFKFNGRQIRLVEYSRTMPAHWCEKGHAGYMLSGEMEVQFENETHKYSAGDGICLPSGPQHKHCARILTETATLIFVEDV